MPWRRGMESGRQPLQALALGLSLCISEKRIVYNLERGLHPFPLWQSCHPTSLSILLRGYGASFYPSALILDFILLVLRVYVCGVGLCLAIWEGRRYAIAYVWGSETNFVSQVSLLIFMQTTGSKLKLSESSSKISYQLNHHNGPYPVTFISVY